MRAALGCLWVIAMIGCGDDVSVADGGPDPCCDGGADLGGDAGSTFDQGVDSGPADSGPPDGGPTEGVLTEAERVAVAEQLQFELEQMGIFVNTASDAAEQHPLVIRPPHPWTFFTFEPFCIVNDEFPKGCREGTNRFDPNFAFDQFEPEVSYEFMWSGEVGDLAGESAFTLTGVPTSWIDGRPAMEPNTDALLVIRAHDERVVVEAGGGGVWDFERTATKDFDIVLPGEPLRMAHTDTTTARASGPAFERDLMSMRYEATFTGLDESDITVFVEVDLAGVVTGAVSRGARVLGEVSGDLSDDRSVVTWLLPPAELDLGGCTPDCGARVCGLEPACGTDCGVCAGSCSAGGFCEEP